MEQLFLHYDDSKFKQCVNFFNKKLPIAGILLIGKLLYLSERYHLRRYGRLISDNEYMLNMAGIVPKNIVDYSNHVEPFDDVFLSKSDVDSLTLIFESYGHMRLYDLIEYCKKLPEFTYATGRFNLSKSPIVDVRDFLLEPKEDVQELYPLSDYDRECVLELLVEASDINKLLHGG